MMLAPNPPDIKLLPDDICIIWFMFIDERIERSGSIDILADSMDDSTKSLSWGILA